MGNINVTIRMDEHRKEQADELFDDLGVGFSGAVNAFVSQSLRENRIPFEITRNGATDRGLGLSSKTYSKDSEDSLKKLSARLMKANCASSISHDQYCEGDEIDVMDEMDDVMDAFVKYAFLQQRLGTLISIEEFFEAESQLYLNTKQRVNADLSRQVADGLNIAGSAMIPLVNRALSEMIQKLREIQNLPPELQIEIMDYDISGCDFDKLIDREECDIDVQLMLSRLYSEQEEDAMAAYEEVLDYLRYFYKLKNSSTGESEGF